MDLEETVDMDTEASDCESDSETSSESQNSTCSDQSNNSTQLNHSPCIIDNGESCEVYCGIEEIVTFPNPCRFNSFLLEIF